MAGKQLKRQEKRTQYPAGKTAQDSGKQLTMQGVWKQLTVEQKNDLIGKRKLLNTQQKNNIQKNVQGKITQDPAEKQLLIQHENNYTSSRKTTHHDEGK